MKWRPKLFEHSLLARLGVILAVVIMLGITSMLSAMIIAETTKGEAGAINLVGSLRMQSYRISSLLMDQANHGSPDHTAAVTAAMDRLEATILSPQLAAALPSNPFDERRIGYEQVLTTWQKAMRPLFSAHLKLITQETLDAQEMRVVNALGERTPQLLPSVQIFVAHIDDFVTLLEEDIESKNLLLRVIQGTALLLMLVVVFSAIYMVQENAVGPMHNLLQTAERLRNHDLTARVTHTSPDELGQLGQAFNLMAEELSRLYEDLERRVEEKTDSLGRSNRSLNLLYRSISHLYQRPVAADTYALLLREFEETLGTGKGSVCLTQDGAVTADPLTIALKRVRGDEFLCSASQCTDCFALGTPRWRTAKDGLTNVLSLPLRDMEGYYGVLQWEIMASEQLDAWQLQLLEALSTHMGIAIGAAQRIEQKRRWSLHEERAVIARELHDSLAQSLSYMKIQVGRLQAILEQQHADDKVQKVLAELRDGLNSAYRQLRELLSTFRLKIEGGLAAALDKTVIEFSSRGNIPISIRTELNGCRLSPNEEIHLLQIVRESLANVIHHAHATQAQVSIRCEPDGMVRATIDDNGVGISAGSTLPKAHHYGLTIMKERARNLQGTISVQQPGEGGTQVELRFLPASQSAPARRHSGGAA